MSISPQVRVLGTVEDHYGFTVPVGVDHDAVTIWAGDGPPQNAIRLDTRAKAAFHALMAAATVATDTWAYHHPDAGGSDA